MRLLVVGLSTQQPCGVRAHVDAMTRPLAAEGVETEVVWWDRDASAPLRADLAACGEWAQRIASAAARTAPDAIVWHYSVFSYARRGVPVLEPRVARALRAAGVPVIAFLHEYELTPWRQWGAKGAAFVAAQRPFAAHVLRAATAAVVTTRPRLDELTRARWAPRRPLRFAPVPAALEGIEQARRGPRGERPRVGVFGFGAELYEVETTVGALRALHDLRPELHLLGAPGPDSAAAARWRRAAAGLDLRFSGVLPARELVAALARMDTIVFPEPGPLARRSTVAAALAVGAPTVMLEGACPDWTDPVDAGAMALAPPTPDALAATLRDILGDERRAQGLAAAAREFYARRQAPPVLARELVSLASELR